MKRLFIITFLVLSACAPSVAEPTIDMGVFQTAAVETAFAGMTSNAPEPTNTPAPTWTPRPTVTNTPAPSVDEVRVQLIDAIISDLSNIDDVEVVNLVRFNAGTLEVEVKTLWASQDTQPDVSWQIVSYFSEAFADFNRDGLERVGGGPFVLSLTTYSTRGDYRYQSLTNWDTLKKIGGKSISYEEWVTVAGAGFR